MDHLCKDGMFECAFELVFGLGFGIIALIFVASLLGFEFKDKDVKK